jgi:hypothetical protein
MTPNDVEVYARLTASEFVGTEIYHIGKIIQQ